MRDESTTLPIFYFDNDCGFCRFWKDYWQKLTGNRVVFKPLEDAKHKTSSLFVDVDGSLYKGAEGVLRLLSFAPGRKWYLWMYLRIPGVRQITEFAYKQISACRSCGARATRVLWGRCLEPSSFFFTRRLFIRLLGIVYLVAFLSFGFQIPGLIGDNGILPAQSFFESMQSQGFGFLDAPSLAWIDASTSTLQLIAWIGATLAVLLIVGIQLAPVLFFLWLLYLSLVFAGQTFMSFQWDILLLEAGFLAIFFAPLSFGSKYKPSQVIVWLFRLLVFRLMFFSGYVKLASGDVTWRNLEALDFHYFTQPLPNAISWFAHQIPSWIDHVSVLIMFGIQLILPFFIFLPRRLRFFAGLCFIGLELFIGLTGNYTFFNLLTIALILLLFDDSFFRRHQPRSTKMPSMAHVWTNRILACVIVVLFLTSTPTSFRLVNRYGLFARMTTTRPEIIVEGTLDGETWLEYGFKYKPQALDARPVQVAPHQPRLDWQMWFAALTRYDQTPWFKSFALELLLANPDVLDLLANDPFDGQRPQQIRAKLYEYEFTSPIEREQTGDWWKREGKGLYLPVTGF